jgi:hypothetical protein
LIAASLLSAELSFARDENFSPWQPTNAIGMSYRWQTDDLWPHACVVQLTGADQSQVRSVSISYRSTRGFRMVLSGLRLLESRGADLERTLVGCTRIEKVEVWSNPATTTIIAGRFLDGRPSSVGDNYAP